MNISISVAATPCAMPQIMFAGDLEARCALLAGLGYDGIDMFFPDPQGTDARTAKAALDRNGLRATMLAAQGDLMAAASKLPSDTDDFIFHFPPPLSEPTALLLHGGHQMSHCGQSPVSQTLCPVLHPPGRPLRHCKCS